MVKILSSVHTRLGNALALRKEVLETALRATELLQQIKRFKKENEGKKRLINQFKKEISAIHEAVHELEFKDLPSEITKKIEPKIEVKPKKQIEKEIKEEIEKPVVKSELQQELDSLKTKIENIKI